MPQPRSLRVDAIIGNYAVTYGAGLLVAEQIAPILRVTEVSGIYNVFSAYENITDGVDDVRAPGAVAPEVTWSKSTATYNTKEHARRTFVTEEEVGMAQGIDAFFAATRLVKDQTLLGWERRVKALLTTTTNHGTVLPASALWTTVSTDIEGDVEAAKVAVRNLSGFQPNTWVVPSNVAPYIRKNTNIRTYLTDQQLQSGTLPDALFGLRIVTPTAVYNTANPGQATQNRTQVWDGTTSEVMYIDPNPGVLAPTWGLTFLLTTFGINGERTMTYHVDERHGDWVEYARKQDERVTFKEAGCIITGVSA